MTTHTLRSPRWNTASFSDSTDTTPMELSELGEHIDRCNGCRGRWFALRCFADSVHGFVAPRFVTTLLVAGVLTGIAAFAL